MINVILCGGNGTRLWPLSREQYPKQFIEIFDNQSLFQKTVLRNKEHCDDFLIVSNIQHHFLATDQLSKVNLERNKFILEPSGRNTAPAIALACLELDSEDILLVTPSDHLISEGEAYDAAIDEAKLLAESGYLVTFGINPDYPETGFGYIQAEGNNVISFREKPDYDTALKYMDDGNYYWNSGMFMFRVGVFLEELELYAPEVLYACKEAISQSLTVQPKVIGSNAMLNIPSISVDYAVMEKSKKIKMLPSEFKWTDLGSFDAIYNEFDRDEYGNCSNNKSIHVNSNNNLVLSEKTVVTVDVEDLIMVDTDDALLISKKGSSMKMKRVIEELKKKNEQLTKFHTTAYRPWGTAKQLEKTENYKIKRIVVKPGQKLMMQKHFHRSEHWIVLSGTAVVRSGDNEIIIRPNESMYIPIGKEHQLINPGKIDLVLIEVQVGDYVEEDDIVIINSDRVIE